MFEPPSRYFSYYCCNSFGKYAFVRPRCETRRDPCWLVRRQPSETPRFWCLDQKTACTGLDAYQTTCTSPVAGPRPCRYP